MDGRARPTFRPLLPVTLVAFNSGAGAGEAGGNGRVAVTPRRKNIDLACLACRKRNVRCNGEMSQCSTYVKRGIPCEYPEDDEQTSRVLKRKLADTEERLQTHEELESIMQSKRNEENLAIIGRLRNARDVRSVLQYIKDGDLLLQMSLAPETCHCYTFPLVSEIPLFLHQRNNPYLRSHTYKCVNELAPEEQRADHGGNSQIAQGGFEAQYRAPYHAAKIVKPRLESARPSNWTLVPASDNLLRELLQAYFLREYPKFTMFHKDHFLEDIVAGRKRYCSSLLVNAILAAACYSYSRAEYRTKFWNPQSLQYQFSAEPTNIQASLIVALTNNMNGVDEIGWLYTEQSVTMANRMRIFDPPPATITDRRKAANCMGSVYFPICPLPDPNDSLAWYPKVWITYPLSKNPIPIRLGDYFKAITEFRVLLNEIGRFAFPETGTQRKLSFEESWAFYLKLDRWYENLPHSLSSLREALPFQFLTHLHYFNIAIFLLEPFTTSETRGVDSDDALDDTLRGVVIDARIRFETVFRLYYLRHGF
ncbi:Zn(2)-C6 fungal-type DNA-binding domain protein [Fusarium austroafricanum]|uniref:Zn(2)-C6 fungal-type DNA-binding domain protein n=1 Tax=Fusarium austroafricanum TaxID=2364996 RepID=A0A8H4K9Z0_9HYPO|nr:Zn(2)-C6 fungal-type DNA-binding domain protein [Fusarium austroafricanum]